MSEIIAYRWLVQQSQYEEQGLVRIAPYQLDSYVSRCDSVVKEGLDANP